MKKLVLIAVALLLFAANAYGEIPAAPVLTFYQFSGKLETSYYSVDSFIKNGPRSPAGTLAQGSSIIPCLVVRDGKPVMDGSGTPYVGFELVVDSKTAGPDATEIFREAVEKQNKKMVNNHHCGAGTKYVIDVRDFFHLEKAPFMTNVEGLKESKVRGKSSREVSLDTIVRAFHGSPQCIDANKNLIGRRSALARSWESFIDENSGRWTKERLQKAKHLDYTMRTAIYEGHLDRGCSSYGACERNIIALSIRNRGREGCSRAIGCNYFGDYQGIASKVSQYNIWDEYLAQISGLTSCYLSERNKMDSTATTDAEKYYSRIQSMYEQNVNDVERILFEDDAALKEIFPGNSISDLKSMRHYYHAPAMGKCFPGYPRVDYITGAIAKKGDDYALIANQRLQIDDSTAGGYYFRVFKVKYEEDKDEIELLNSYPGFVVDARKVSLKNSNRCIAYGIPSGCPNKKVGRWRKPPSWLHSGRPLAISCSIRDRGESCSESEKARSVEVGGKCDTNMRPVSGIK